MSKQPDNTPQISEGPGKGKAFFDRARTVAESGNYDYAIDMYIEGLNREPQNLVEHEALRDISLRRKIQGGKSGGGGLRGSKTYFKGKTPKDAMLNAEYQLAKDPGNIPAMQVLLKQANTAGYIDVLKWFGPIFIHANRTQKTPQPRMYLEMADFYEGIGEFRLATDCVQAALQMTPNDMDLIGRIKDLSAKHVLQEGKYEGGGDFKDSLKNKEETQELLQEEQLDKSEQHRRKRLEQARADYDANKLEHQNIAKYVAALLEIEEEDDENQAIDVLNQAYKNTGSYRYKLTIGNVRMKQFKRNARLLTDAIKDNPADRELREEYRHLEEEQLKFELQEFADRVKHYPTDQLFMYEYGRRLYLAKRFDEAITAFQQAQHHPKHRAHALHLLGRSFMERNMKDEAADTLKRAIEEYELADTGDRTSKEFYYWLGRVNEDLGRSQEAMATYSKITQWDISFADTRQRLERLRKERQSA